MPYCTPQYNEETRRLMRHAADLRRVADGAKTGDFGAAIRAKANEVIDRGETDPQKVIDAVHGFINEHVPHSKEEVAQAIADRKPRTPSEAAERRAQVRAQIRDLQDVNRGLDAGNAERGEKSARQASQRLNAQISDLTRQIESGVNTARERGQPVDTPEVRALRERRDALRHERDMQEPAPAPTRPAALTEAQLRETNPSRAAERQQRFRLQAQIDRLNEKIAAGETERPGKVQTADSAEVTRLKDERDAAKRELDNMRPAPEASRPLDPNAGRNRARLKALTDENAELTRQLRDNDFPAKQPRSQTYKKSEDVAKAELDRDALKRQIENVIAKGERLNASPIRKTLNFIHDLHLFDIFTSLMVYPKLAAAVVGGHAHSLISGATINLAKMMPAIRRIAEKAPDYGSGMTAEGLKARFGEGLRTAPKAALETLKHGASKLEMAHGDTARASEAYLIHIGTLHEALQTEGALNKTLETARVLTSYAPRTHGFVKQFLSNPAFFESKANQTLQLTKLLKSQGRTPDEIAEFLGRDSTKAAINSRAIARAYDEKMQGKNRWNDALLGAIYRLDQSPHPGANLAAFIFKSILPIVRVGPNIFKQGTSMMFGGVKAALEAAGKGDMTPERSDYIMKNIGAQGTGALLMALGATFSGSFGGIEGASAKKRKDQEKEPIKPGEGEVGGIPVGSWGFHGAPMAMLNMGAGLVKVYEEDRGLSHDDAVTAALYSLGSNVKNWAERTLPYTDYVRRTANTLEYGRARGKYGTPWGEVAGNQLRSMTVPSILQQEAKREDEFKGFRRPRNITEDLKLGIPGYREEVPTR